MKCALRGKSGYTYYRSKALHVFGYVGSPIMLAGGLGDPFSNLVYTVVSARQIRRRVSTLE